ncbi:MAG: site-specific integrase [Burkholderiaceae bacterium]|nr:site-specific integrase [Burkholderiaceae bacterium]
MMLIESLEHWLAHEARQGRLRRPTSAAIYRAMWQALSRWALARRPAITDVKQLTAPLLSAYIAERERCAHGGEPWTDRYTWRLLSLVRRVQAHDALLRLKAPQDRQPQPEPSQATALTTPVAVRAPLGGPAQHAGHTAGERDPLLAARPAVRWANRQSQQPPLAHLDAPAVRRLFRALARRRQAWRQGRSRWQDLRDTVALALQLGAGLGPTDLRALQIQDLHLDATPADLLRRPGPATPWPDQPPGSTLRLRRPSAGGPPNPPGPYLLAVPANGSAAAYRAPLAAWASRLLCDWLHCRTALALPGPWLFPSTRSGKPWGKVAQYEAAARVLADAQVPAQAAGGSFRLRHSFALRQLALGHDPAQVARWLGVSDPGVMQRYQRSLGTGQNQAPDAAWSDAD